MPYRKSPRQIEKSRHIQRLNSISTFPHPHDEIPVSPERLAEFVTKIQGKVVFPWSEGYDQDRQDFNNLYPATPFMIVYVACYNDIKECLDFAVPLNFLTTIRSGGHSLADYSVCDGMIIDMSQLNNISVDVAAKKAVIEAGCTFERIYPVIETYNLHIPGGDCPTVAIGGFMQGGGYGLTSRAYGMNCDCVIEVSVMLANGTIVVANATQNQDLFWAVRGGTGGNFGVLLSVTYHLFNLGDMYGIQAKWVIDQDPENASKALYAIQENYLTKGAYPNLGIETVLTTDSDGLMKVFFCASWIGSEDSFNEALQPLTAIPGADFGPLITGKYSYVNETALNNTPPNLPEDIKAYSRSAYISRMLTQAEWKDILTFFLTAPNKYTMVDMECYGGKINAIPAGKNAFIHRDTTMDFFCDAFFNKETNDQHANEVWIESLFNFMRAYTNGHSYQNYPNRLQQDFRRAYWGQYYNQLVYIKQKYDPTNFFNYQQSIGPDIIIDPDQIHLFTPNEILYDTV